MVAEEGELHSPREAAAEARVNGNGLGQPEIDAVFAHTRAELSTWFASMKRLAFVQMQAMRLRAIDAGFSLAFLLCILGIVLAVSISAATLLVSGTKGALRALTGSAWVGDLATGVLVLTIVVVSAFAARTSLRNRLIKQTEKRLARTPAAPKETHA